MLKMVCELTNSSALCISQVAEKFNAIEINSCFLASQYVDCISTACPSYSYNDCEAELSFRLDAKCLDSACRELDEYNNFYVAYFSFLVASALLTCLATYCVFAWLVKKHKDLPVKNRKANIVQGNKYNQEAPVSTFTDYTQPKVFAVAAV